MCCLYGLLDYRHHLNGWEKSHIVTALAVESEARGTDAAGIAYNSGGQLHIYKRPGPAHKLRFHIPEDAYVVMGHTRLTTQGNEKRNRNNHPFRGSVPGTSFALAHNGVLHNDRTLRRTMQLPATKIETDSYIAVQLLEQQKALTPASLKSMAETVEGSFVFTVLDDKNSLCFVKGDNPLCLVQLPHLGLYLYASTKAILWAALDRLGLKKELLTELPVDEGEIIMLSPDGARHSDYFDYTGHWSCGWFSGFNGSYRRSSALSAYDDSYLQQLKNIAASLGHTGEEIDALLADGFSTDELEELLYHYGVCY